jgi:hypothetical protein
MWHFAIIICTLAAAAPAERPLAEDPTTLDRPNQPRPPAAQKPDGVAAAWRSSPEWRPTWIALAGAGVVLAYYGAAYLLTGPRRRPRDVPVKTQPPSKLSPAAASYLASWGCRRRTSAAALVSLLAKGAIVVERGPKGPTIKPTDASVELASEEKRLLKALFADDQKEAPLARRKSEALQRGAKALKKELDDHYREKWFRAHHRLWIAGVILSLVVVVGALLAGPIEELFVTLFFLVWLSGWTVGTGLLVLTALAAWMGAIAGDTRWVKIGKPRGSRPPSEPTRLGAAAVAVFMSLFAVPFVLGEVFAIGVVIKEGQPAVFLVGMFLAALAAFFCFALRSRTLDGEEQMRQVAGFRKYLSDPTGSASLLTAPLASPALFEQYLPYAVGLGRERAWAESFRGLPLDADGQASPLARAVRAFRSDETVAGAGTVAESLTLVSALKKALTLDSGKRHSTADDEDCCD